ncbi:MAG: sugar ABC transporter permease [Ruminococcaceae bacterium]|nr:sugar ABC transporter permease [Oscillospiraceae bacterium]
MNRKKSNRIFVFVCTLPPLILFCLFTIYPLFDGLYMSFYKWSGLSGKKIFLGLDNYHRLLTDPIIPKTIINDYFLVVVKVIFIIALALLFAVVLTQLKPRGTAFYRFVYFFPNVMPVVTTAILWTFIFSSNMGLFNALLDILGLEHLKRTWLGDLHTALPCIALVLIWAGVGLFMLMLMGTISNIPQELYEAADIDGASKWRQFYQITIPLIWPQIKTSVVYIIITTLNGSYVLVQLTTLGGPANATQVMGSYLYQQAFTNYNFGYAAAIGVMILVLNLATVLITQFLLRREKVEY